ncbi:polysaccharide pyruvyl transferase family protein [Caballeronia sp. ATUFL_M2_KS44]|uniref:polysaccharide pyruvyl transferase family protein n=1 Tax=Caballeronia sp. ATUFL_M2_KS44 TaxID=2921767 RepID=UPI002028D0DC|nr:polysaccharide pyruvyl transferase family protein [Caballeronia sp. ATUFL_M2_KS44]
MPNASAQALAPRPVIVFGAFDRHNFGDILFAHVIARLLREHRPDAQPVIAGLAARDLRDCGGHDVAALAPLAARWRDAPVSVIHAGGEVLTCDAWEAAVMFTRPEDAQACIARHGARADDRRAWARATLHTGALAPYIAGRETFARASSICCNAIGGVMLDSRDAAFRAEVLTKLRSADFIGVRDMHTQNALQAAGIAARLMPDPVSIVAELFDERIRARARHDAVANVRHAFARGYVAVQFSADFGDDATLARLAHQLDSLAAKSGFGIALFRAGAATWHDDIAVYERLAARMRHRDVTVFRSLDVWDICALIAHSAGFAGSSLHGRIVAMAYALPRVNIVHSDDTARIGKQAAYAQTWEIEDMPRTVRIDDLAAAMHDALDANLDALVHRARELAGMYRKAVAPLVAKALER